MSTILLAINPQHVNNIMKGQKKYEFRKIQCKEKVDTILIYSTSPIKKIVGQADVSSILVDTPSKIWEMTHQYSGITKDFFDKYYQNKNKAIAYQLTNVIQYDDPKDLVDYGITCAPQSFVYLP